MIRLMQVVLAVLISIPLQLLAGIITLQPSGSNCTYQRIEVGQLGNIIVTCKEAVLVVPTPQPHPRPPEAPPPAGCNPGAIRTPIPWEAGAAQSQMIQSRARSGEIFSYRVPPPYASYTSLNFTQGQQPASGRAITEYSVSTCPGVIDRVPPDKCALKTTGVAYNVQTIWTNTAHTGFCNALGAGPWYINVRWTWPEGCPFGDGNCGFTLQWASGT